MNRKTPTTIALLLFIALSTGACQQTAERIKGQLAKAKNESEDTSLTPEEQFALGVAYYYGEGVEQAPTQATHWWRKAAEQGHAQAQYDLALAYDEGIGVLKDLTQATHWWRKAAEQGHALAQTRLGLAYASGSGVEEDWTQAYAWAIIAQATGGETEKETEAIRKATNLFESELTPAQITQGQQRAKELHKQIQANIAERDQAN